MENADAENVVPAADFLQSVAGGAPMDLTGKKVVLIGGGNVAMDAARTAVRLGAETIHVFTRKRDDMTALFSEVESAMQEGVRFRTLLDFLNIEVDKETGKVCAVWLQPEIVGEYDRLGISNGERIIVRSRRGAIDATARVGRKVSEGETWMPFHFPDSPVNRITNAVFDEFARIPEYKVCAVALEKMPAK